MMKRIEEPIIRIKNLNLTYAYLNETDVRRKEMCHQILEQAFATMRAPASLDTKAKTLSNLLDRSIGVLERDEIFEEAQIILDIKNEVPEIIKKLKSQSAQENT